MQETWEKWVPISKLADKYHLKNVESNINGFRIDLSHASNKTILKIVFKKSVWSYRNVDEGFRLILLEDLFEKYGPDFYGNWTLFEVKNSAYLNWLSLQSHKSSDGYKLKHFCIIATDDILDIISSYEPEVSLSEI